MRPEQSINKIAAGAPSGIAGLLPICPVASPRELRLLIQPPFGSGVTLRFPRITARRDAHQTPTTLLQKVFDPLLASPRATAQEDAKGE